MNEEEQKAWTMKVAVLAVDALVDARLIDQTVFEQAARIVEEEICVRLALGDYPPPQAANE